MPNDLTVTPEPFGAGRTNYQTVQPPSIIPGPGAGTGGAVTVPSGTGLGGLLQINIGTGPVANAIIATVLFAHGQQKIPGVVLFPANAAAAGLNANTQPFLVPNPGGFEIRSTGIGGLASTMLLYNYVIAV